MNKPEWITTELMQRMGMCNLTNSMQVMMKNNGKWTAWDVAYLYALDLMILLRGDVKRAAEYNEYTADLIGSRELGYELAEMGLAMIGIKISGEKYFEMTVAAISALNGYDIEMMKAMSQRILLHEENYVPDEPGQSNIESDISPALYSYESLESWFIEKGNR